MDRRKRDLKKWFVIKKALAKVIVGGKTRNVTLYRYADVRSKIVDQGQVSLKERAEVSVALMVVVRCAANPSNSTGSRS